MLVTQQSKVLTGKLYSSDVIPKACGVRKTFFRVSTPKETKDTGMLDKQFSENFFSHFCLCSGYKNNMKEKNLPSNGLAYLWRI